MSDPKAVVLDGMDFGDLDLAPLLAILTDILARSGYAVQQFSLRELKIGHCTGCFACWLETPGVCVESDAGRQIARAILGSEMTILFTPISFGGYSSQLKKISDRWIPLSLPHFDRYFGEIHHKPRYSDYPRFVGIGVQRRPDRKEAGIFKLVVGRNAINFHTRSHAAEVVVNTDTPEMLRSCFQSLLTRVDPLPSEKVLRSFLPMPDAAISKAVLSETPRALLIVGSPKTRSPSTSGVLGGYLLERLKSRGWEIESLILRASLRSERGQADLLSAVDRADLLILSFPLYIDALPFLLTKALEVITAHRQILPNRRSQRIAVICNNGFPEAYQNIPALAICHQFAVQTGITWAGSLAMGAGEALCSGRPLSATSRADHPPVKHVMRALDMAGDALAEGGPVPAESVRLITVSPIPFVPFAMWRWIYLKSGMRYWQRMAAENGISKKKMLDRPYAA